MTMTTNSREDFQPVEAVQLFNSGRMVDLERNQRVVLLNLFKDCELVTNGRIGGTLVDVGCGQGQDSVAFAEYFDDVIGIDSSVAQIERLNEVNQLQNVRFKVGAAENLPVSDSIADVIIVIFSLHFFDVDSFVKECRRVLKPGGVAFFYTHALCGMDSLENDRLPAIVKEVEQANRKCLAIAEEQHHPQRHVLDHHESLFESINWPNKRKVTAEVTTDIDLQSLTFLHLRIPFYHRLGYHAGNPLWYLFDSVKRIWSMEDRNAEDIKIRATSSASVVILELNDA